MSGKLQHRFASKIKDGLDKQCERLEQQLAQSRNPQQRGPRMIDISFIPEGKERDDFLRTLVATPKEKRQQLMEQTMAQYGKSLPTIQ